MRLGALLGTVLWLMTATLLPGSAHGARCEARPVAKQLARLDGRAGRPKVVERLCFDITRDGRRDLAVSVAGRGARVGATRWVVFRRIGRRFRFVRRGGVMRTSRRRRGGIDLRRRGRDLVVSAPLWRLSDRDECPTGGLRRGRYRWHAGRLRRIRRARVGPTPAGRCARPAPPQQPAPPGRCLNAGSGARDIGVSVRDVPAGTQGKVLPGQELRSQVLPPSPSPYEAPDPLSPHYPSGRLPEGPPSWRGLDGIGPDALVRAADADARFNDEDARYRVAFHLSHYGGMPDRAGDFNRDGVEDLLISEHFSYVDGMQFAGEVHLYFGHRGRRIDPRLDVPDVIFYGDEKGGKIGISLAPAGDMNGDGWDDIVMSAAFRSTGGGKFPDGGQVYVVYGGFLHRFRCPVKVRAEDIGSKVPGLMLEGGHDGRSYTAWANGLEGGDFNGDGLGDLLIGAYNPYKGSAPTFAARGYLLYGSRALPRRFRGYRLGVDGLRSGIRTGVFELPDGQLTRKSLGFGAYFVGDLNDDGKDEIAFTVSFGGPGGQGSDHLFLGRAEPLSSPTPILGSDITVEADAAEDRGLRFSLPESARPAGDVNGDGVADLLITARGTRRLIDGRWQLTGGAGILYGRSSLPSRIGYSQLDVLIPSTIPGGFGHPAMDRGADLDGDGYSDLLLNDPYFQEPIGTESQYRGRVWLLPGGPSLPDIVNMPESAALHFLADTRVPGMFGYTWNVGDWNADGRPDLVVGDHYSGDSDLHDHAGRVYLFYNGSSFSPP